MTGPGRAGPGSVGRSVGRVGRSVGSAGRSVGGRVLLLVLQRSCHEVETDGRDLRSCKGLERSGATRHVVEENMTLYNPNVAPNQTTTKASCSQRHCE